MYRRDADASGLSRKNQLPSMRFKMSVAHCLTRQGESDKGVTRSHPKGGPRPKATVYRGCRQPIIRVGPLPIVSIHYNRFMPYIEMSIQVADLPS